MLYIYLFTLFEKKQQNKQSTSVPRTCLSLPNVVFKWFKPNQLKPVKPTTEMFVLTKLHISTLEMDSRQVIQEEPKEAQKEEITRENDYEYYKRL